MVKHNTNRKMLAAPISEIDRTRVPPISAEVERPTKIRQPVPLSPVWRLNALQVLMRRWSRFGPYVAGQVLRFRGTPHRRRWEDAATAIVSESGFGPPHFTRQDHAVQFAPPSRIAFESVTGPLTDYLNRELNLSFQDHELPLRFFLRLGDDDSYEMGLIYNHWLADSLAIRELLLRISDRYRETEFPATIRLKDAKNRSPQVWRAPDFHELFRSHLNSWEFGSALRAAIQNLIKHASAYRIPLQNSLDFTTGFLRTTFPAGLIAQLHLRAKDCHVSVNDLFLAVLGQVMSKFTQEGRQQSWHRKQLGLGLVVDLRGAANVPLKGVFGAYMSLATVVLKDTDQQDTLALAAQIADHTRRLKQPRERVRSIYGLKSALFASNYLVINNKHRSIFYQLNTPVVVSLSNVNIRSGWNDPDVLEYSRITPLGPPTPLAFTTTTLGERANVSVTYRTTAFQSSQVETLMREFVAGLVAVADAATVVKSPE